MLSRAVFVLSTASILASAAVVDAQIAYNVPSRWTVGGDFAISQPKGAFAENIPTGYGFDVNGLMKIDPKGWFSLRADGGNIQYGHEHIGLGFFSGVELNLDTNNKISFGSLGVQLQIPEGWFRPYASASYAAVYLSTESCVSNPDQLVEEACRTNQGDWVGATVIGGGVQIPLGTSFSGILGARYHYGGEATYLRRGDIVDNPDGSVTLNVRNSKTDLVLWQIGISYNFPRSIGR